MTDLTKKTLLEQGFDIGGEHYSVISPKNLDDLIAALHIKDLLDVELERDEPDQGHAYYFFREEQSHRISEYLDSLGEFDNTILVKNILHLTKKTGIGIGTLERIVGISPGYISRTAKENSGKRMSIDAVWKIARILDVSMSTLLGIDMSYPNHNTILTVRFIERLAKETGNGIVDWSNLGGKTCALNKNLASIGYFESDIIFGDVIYKPEHLDDKAKFVISADTYSCYTGGQNLIIVPYRKSEEEKTENYDFYFLNKNKRCDSYYITLVFSTSGDITGEIKEKTDELYHIIEMQQNDMKLSTDVKDFMTYYLE